MAQVNIPKFFKSFSVVGDAIQEFEDWYDDLTSAEKQEIDKSIVFIDDTTKGVGIYAKGKMYTFSDGNVVSWAEYNSALSTDGDGFTTWTVQSPYNTPAHTVHIYEVTGSGHQEVVMNTKVYQSSGDTYIDIMIDSDVISSTISANTYYAVFYATPDVAWEGSTTPNYFYIEPTGTKAGDYISLNLSAHAKSALRFSFDKSADKWMGASEVSQIPITGPLYMRWENPSGKNVPQIMPQPTFNEKPFITLGKNVPFNIGGDPLTLISNSYSPGQWPSEAPAYALNEIFKKSYVDNVNNDFVSYAPQAWYCKDMFKETKLSKKLIEDFQPYNYPFFVQNMDVKKSSGSQYIGLNMNKSIDDIQYSYDLKNWNSVSYNGVVSMSNHDIVFFRVYIKDFSSVKTLGETSFSFQGFSAFVGGNIFSLALGDDYQISDWPKNLSTTYFDRMLSTNDNLIYANDMSSDYSGTVLKYLSDSYIFSGCKNLKTTPW